MSDQDVRNAYKSREVRNEYDSDINVRRPRIPTTVGPYDYPRDAELPYKARARREHYGESEFDVRTNISTPRTVKSTYPAKSNHGSQDVFLDVERPRGNDRSFDDYIPRDEAREANRNFRKSIVLDQDYDGRVPTQSASPFPSSPRGSGDLAGNDYRRVPARTSQYGVDIRHRKVDDYGQRGREPFVLETRGQVEIIMPGRNLERGDGRGPRYVYEMGQPRGPMVTTANRDGRGGEITVIRGDCRPSLQPPQSYGNDGRRTPSRTRPRDFDTQDDWKIVESMRDTRIGPDGPREGYRRSRAATHSSEDSYVMVSPERGQSQMPSQIQNQSTRSSFQQKDLPPAELHRRRSRSISFRDSEVNSHEAGDRRHERPGTEAQLLGYYLGRKAESDVSTARESRVSTRERQQSRYADDDDDHRTQQAVAPYREAYPPQQGHAPKSRSRSRRRRNDHDDNDNESYYSERVDKVYRKKTEYY